MFILNDTHLGTTRKAGATPTSALALKQYLQAEFAHLVSQRSGHLCLLGDTFDHFTVEAGDVIQAFTTLSTHLAKGHQLTLVAGNHDYAPRQGTSSFHLLAHILKSQFHDSVNVIDHTSGLSEVEPGVWALPHLANQALFDLEIEKALGKSEIMTLLVHCNIMSPFAEHSDNSLNLSQSQLESLVAAGFQVISAHEHAARTLFAGRVYVIGNQIASSVSDCINDLNPVKNFIELVDGEIIEHESVRVADVFAKLDWRNLDDVDPDLKFIRVGGEAGVEEAAQAVTAVANLRQRHAAFVISNAVLVDGMTNEMEVASLETVKSFDVFGALMDVLTPEEGAVIKKLMEE